MVVSVPRLPAHLLVERDNIDALPALAGELADQVDLAYLDPPYGRADPTRNSSRHVVAYTDHRRGEAWTAWLRPRLAALTPALAPRGVVAASVDHHHLHALAALMQEVWPDCELVTITIAHAVPRPADALGVRHDASYVLLSVPPEVRLRSPGHRHGARPRSAWSPLLLTGHTAARYPRQTYPIWVDRETLRIVGAGQSVHQLREAGLIDDPATFDYTDIEPAPEGCVSIWPLTRHGRRGVWRLTRTSCDEAVAGGWVSAVRSHMPGAQHGVGIRALPRGVRARIEVGEIEAHGRDPVTGALIVGDVTSAGDGTPTVWSGGHLENRAGTERLHELIGDGHGFGFPKPVGLLIDVLRATGSRRDAIVLDPFAGSGTTADAVMQLNAVDGGLRRAVLIQSSEAGIFDRVTVPRVMAANTRSEPVEVRRAGALSRRIATSVHW